MNETDTHLPIRHTNENPSVQPVEPTVVIPVEEPKPDVPAVPKKQLEVSKETKDSWSPSLEKSTDKIVAEIMDTDDPDDLKQLISGFNVSQSKKNILRILKLNNLLDLVTEETLRRYKKSPDEISNKELMDCMTTVSEQIERSQAVVDGISTKPAIQINQQKNEYNVNVGPSLTKDEKENVIDIVTQILAAAQNKSMPQTPSDKTTDKPLKDAADMTIDTTKTGENKN
jgi:hypothetical protein